jgi:hypothetical protein
MMRFALIVCAVIGCARAETTDTTTDPKVVPVSTVGVELSSVTLADDCGDNGPNIKPLPPPGNTKAVNQDPAPKEAASERRAPASDIAAGACAEGANCGGPGPRQCESTSMQVSIKGNGQKTKIKVKQVELLDSSGKVVANLTARKPMKWDGSGYVAWDESVDGGDVSASYLLSAPDWNQLTKGRWNAANHRFQLRVTITVGDKDRQIDKQSIVPALPEPEVVT